MSLGEIAAWIVFGGVAGWVASIIMRENAQLGIVGNVVVGIIGALIGGFLFPHDGDVFDLGSFVAAVIGACLLLLVVNWVTHTNKRV